MIALILPEFNRFFVPDLIKGIQHYADEQGYKVIIFQSGNQFEAEAEIIKYCLSWVVEGCSFRSATIPQTSTTCKS